MEWRLHKMAINRITGSGSTSTDVSNWAFIGSAPAGATMHEFVASGTEGTDTVAGARYRVLTFYTIGTYTPTFDRTGRLDILTVAGGGASGFWTQDNVGGQWIGGGGAGGYLLTLSHIITTPGCTVNVGAGGTGGVVSGGMNGANSTFNAITAFGGGQGGQGSSGAAGNSGGSGGGGNGSGQGGAGTAGQGNSGSSSGGMDGGGGGGAGGTGGSTNSGNKTTGGPGLFRNFDGTWRWYASGGNSGGNTTYVLEGQTPSGVDAQASNSAVPGSGGGGNYYGGGTGDVGTIRGNRGIVIVRFRVA